MHITSVQVRLSPAEKDVETNLAVSITMAMRRSKRDEACVHKKERDMHINSQVQSPRPQQDSSLDDATRIALTPSTLKPVASSSIGFFYIFNNNRHDVI